MKTFRDTNVLITGGLGFIGSNLAIALANEGANVTILDLLVPEYGGNWFNIEPVRDCVEVHLGDIRDLELVSTLVTGKDYIFHLAAQVDHFLNRCDPFPDLDINIRGTVNLLEACKHYNPEARFIYCGTRGEYGHVCHLPADEETPLHPTGLYELSKCTGGQIALLYHSLYGLSTTVLRATNTYGPRSQMKHARYGVVNWFVRLAIDDEVLRVFGDGLIKRDFLFVDDCVNALRMCALSEAACGELFNVGVDHPTTILELIQTLIEVAHSGHWEYAPYTPERAAQEPGDFYSDIAKIQALVGWEPDVPLDVGLMRTVEYYHAFKPHYW
ncbi:MAG: NAD-dependent epimerase/dehydratase family protein [Anaerolineae bacterium]|nr:NAD-dependent epimerase/dehydratase family protein [Anaerolineae bacterium]